MNLKYTLTIQSLPASRLRDGPVEQSLYTQLTQTSVHETDKRKRGGVT